ncbi:MAG: hypothetical protein IPK62_10525 [Bacteroidetes bacterium]|nr:hypothetical protein [Bacteroidota bacterium]
MSDYSSIFVHSSCVSKAQLLAYVQQKLDREEAYLVESHINDCQFCNDALDGLLEANIQNVEKDLLDAKTELKQTIFPAPVQERIVPPKENNIRDFEISKKTFSRWLAAASVLLIIGLGGYSVFSYIKSTKKEMAMKEGKSGGKSYDANYSKPKEDGNEIVNLSVEENDTFRRYASEKPEEKSKKLPKESTPSEPFDKVASTKKLDAPALNNKTVGTAVEAAKPEKKEMVAAPAKNLMNEPAVSEAPAMVDNNARAYEAEKAPAAVSKEIAKKKSAGGMKNENFNVARNNQLSYPKVANNNDNMEPNRQQEVASRGEAAFDEEINEKTTFEKGMEFFNKKNYKKSISYFEKALKKASAAEREDILYHLALAYEYSGKTDKANDLYATLSKSKKYQAEADRKLKEVQIKEAVKKK